MLKLLIPSVAALALIAVAAKTQSATPIEVAPTEAASGQAMGWFVSHEGSEAKLAYGLAQSDQLALMFSCSSGDRSVVVYGDVRPAAARVFQTSTTTDDLDGSSVPLSQSGLRELAGRGFITVAGETGTYRISANAEDRRAVDRFLEYCDQTQA